jgi:uncharacterized membrane protein YphA (DoxX/SURF4 family)
MPRTSRSSSYRSLAATTIGRNNKLWGDLLPVGYTMRTNPFSDVLEFLSAGEWTTYLFWLLIVASIVIAATNLFRNSNQRSIAHLWNWMARFLIGAMWWQQSVWKAPPDFTGLHYWMEEMVKWASTPLQQWFVKDVVLEHYHFFAPQVYGFEVLVALSLMIGLFTRLGALLGMLMAINLWLGLYRSPGEWPWSYFFLIIIQIMFVLQRPGRSLGLDAILFPREKDSVSGGFWRRVYQFLS